MAVQVVGDGAFHNFAGGALIDNAEFFRKADQRRSLAHNVVGEAVQRTHPVADAGEQSSGLDEGVNAGAKVFGGAVGKGDNEDLAVLGCAFVGKFLYQARGKQAQSERLTAAWHRADPHSPAIICEDLLLGRSKENRFVGHNAFSVGSKPGLRQRYENLDTALCRLGYPPFHSGSIGGLVTDRPPDEVVNTD